MKILTEFEKRKKEIGLYFGILEIAELDRPRLSAYNPLDSSPRTVNFDGARINILRATAFLMLYNLVESTVYNAVISIFDAINSDIHNPPLKYGDVIDKVKKYWISNRYKHDSNAHKETTINAFMKIIDHVFNDALILASTDLKYGGSLNAPKIQETADSLGIDTKEWGKQYRKETHGEALSKVKDHRNWLAHGEKTFSEIGQDYTYQQLDDYRKYITEHLILFIKSTEKYIRNKEYTSTNQQ